MSLYQQKQKELFDLIEDDFRKGNIPSTIYEPTSDFENDYRICLTSVSFIPISLQKAIAEKIVKPLQYSDPSLYFYPPDRMHITIQNIQIVKDPPSFNSETIKKAQEIFSKIIPKYPKITFKVNGLFELPGSLALRCYCNESLRELVKDLTKELQSAGIPDNKNYASDEIFFGNITICRFPKQPNQDFFEKVKELKESKIGEFEINTIQLITGNIVFSPDKTKIIQSYFLNPKS